MKNLIKQLLRENISLNLSKQIRARQLASGNEEKLDELFGKGVYRLYYDLGSGKQITPTRHQPKFKMDIQLADKLKNQIDGILQRLGFSIVDFNKNIAKNNSTGQNIKISKVLVDTDKLLIKQYNEYLGALTKEYKGNDKLYVVISRHSHDIAEMSSKPRITSCENMDEYNDISQTWMDIDDAPTEGQGVNIINANNLKTSTIKTPTSLSMERELPINNYNNNLFNFFTTTPKTQTSVKNNVNNKIEPLTNLYGNNKDIRNNNQELDVV